MDGWMDGWMNVSFFLKRVLKIRSSKKRISEASIMKMSYTHLVTATIFNLFVYKDCYTLDSVKKAKVDHKRSVMFDGC